jgi:hypothetical protein
MKQADAILSAETKFKSRLEEFFRKTWGSTPLYSHDIDHHRRVWKYCKELLVITEPEETSADKLIIASFLHDIGMSIDPGFRHGSLSSELCRSFLSENDLDAVGFRDLLEAIEFHDEKEYRHKLSESNPILRILSASDDLDAFGYTGIYRYLEIYLKRGISRPEIGFMIRENASGRFGQFLSQFGNFPDLVEKHRKRYLILDDFMAGYNRNIHNHSAVQINSPWQTIIVEIVSEMMIEKKSPYEIKTLCKRYAHSRLTTEFADNLVSELNETSWKQ